MRTRYSTQWMLSEPSISSLNPSCSKNSGVNEVAPGGQSSTHWLSLWSQGRDWEIADCTGHTVLSTLQLFCYQNSGKQRPLFAHAGQSEPVSSSPPIRILPYLSAAFFFAAGSKIKVSLTMKSSDITLSVRWQCLSCFSIPWSAGCNVDCSREGRNGKKSLVRWLWWDWGRDIVTLPCTL